MGEYLLEMKNITKDFSGVKALNNVNFKVKKGEIHCLVGENGAGKSTLMKVLSGVYPYGNYQGDIVFDGVIQKFNNISDSEKIGISVIYQELSLFPELTVYENIFIGHEIKSGNTVNWNETIVKANKMLERVNLKVNPETKIKDLGVGKQQLIEIAKALSRDVKLLVLDEPTAALNEDDSLNLLNLIRDLKNHGVTSIMISHKLREVIAIADTLTVLRDGQTICSLDKSKDKISESFIIKNMVGREIENIYPPKKNIKFGEKALEVKDWEAFDTKQGKMIVKDINMNVRKGEIVGIAGLMGAGRTELAQSIFGNPRKYKIKGTLLVNNVKKTFHHPKDAIKAGIAYVTEDRKGNGLNLIEDIKNNITIANLAAISSGHIINPNEEIKVANEYKKSMNIKATSIAQIVGSLSGGNQQKVSLSKWLFTNSNILILDEPTRGIDVGAKYEIYNFMNQLVDKGMSIIMISSELPEILGMSDRIYVIGEGKLKGELKREDATQEKIMSLATQ
ncbi:MAG: sugar ABC transporter ATP-binding protein [Oscillospiraceae bacterium]|nr:sugar ABC transporter ATP-binding protein [Oscillospiraceae bacterium]